MIVTPTTIDHLASNVFVDQWIAVDVKFTSVFTDTVVPHTLGSATVKFFVVDSTAGGVVFRGVRASQLNYLVLQSTQVGTFHLILYIEGARSATPASTLPFQSPSPATTLQALQSFQSIAWTPVDGSGAGLTFTAGAWAILVGPLVFVQMQVIYPATANGSAAKIGGLPFAEGVGQNSAFTVGFASTTGVSVLAWMSGSTSAINLSAPVTGAALTNAQLTGADLVISGFYRKA